MDIIASLTDFERSELQTAESAIDLFRQAFWDAGEALEKIKSLKLYRDNYRTFAEYCRYRWNMNRSYADHLIRATAVREILRTTVRIQELADSDQTTNIPLPENERQVRPLVPLKEPERIQQAWLRAVEASKGQPTYKQVDNAVNELYGKPKSQRKKREYTAEEKQQGICDWKYNGGGDGVPSFGVTLHDPEVAIEIERLASEVGKCNATAIGLGMKAYRERQQLQEALDDKDEIIESKDATIAQLTEQLNQKNAEIEELTLAGSGNSLEPHQIIEQLEQEKTTLTAQLQSATKQVWELQKKLQALDETTKSTIGQKDKRIAELEEQLSQLQAINNGHQNNGHQTSATLVPVQKPKPTLGINQNPEIMKIPM